MAFKVNINGNVQYASREAGIKAHAEDYSFNIESELFQQLTPEQQILWRKKIEQAVVSGGHCGLELAKDKRYDEEPVSEDLDKEIDNAHKLFYEEVGWDSDEGARAYVVDWFAHYFANWQKEQLMSKAVKVNISNASIVSIPVNCDLKVGDKVLIIKEN